MACCMYIKWCIRSSFMLTQITTKRLLKLPPCSTVSRILFRVMVRLFPMLSECGQKQKTECGEGYAGLAWKLEGERVGYSGKKIGMKNWGKKNYLQVNALGFCRQIQSLSFCFFFFLQNPHTLEANMHTGRESNLWPSRSAICRCFDWVVWSV